MIIANIHYIRTSVQLGIYNVLLAGLLSAGELEN